MAKVLNPLMSMDAHGSTQALTFAHTRAGIAVRRKGMPPNRFRTTQPGNRAIMGFIATQWAALTVTQRAEWAIWAAGHPQPDGFGGTFIMSGFNAFVHLNQAKMVAFPGGGVVGDPPIISLVATPATLAAAMGIVSGSIDCTWTLNGTGVALDSCELWISDGHVGIGCYDGLKGWKKAKSVAGNLLLGSVTDLQAGAYYGVRLRYVQKDGQRSNFLQTICKAKV